MEIEKEREREREREIWLVQWKRDRGREKWR